MRAWKFWALVTIAFLVAAILTNPTAFLRGWNRGTCISTSGAVCPNEWSNP